MSTMKTRVFLLVALLAAACDDSNGVTEPSGHVGVDAGPGPTTHLDAGLDEAGKPKDCFDPPFTTHLQIINACTNADKIDRKPTSSKIKPGVDLPKP